MVSLNVKSASKEYADGTTALRNVSFSLEPGERVILLGSNGSGKSTALKCAIRLEELTSGVIFLGDVEVNSARGRRLRDLRRGVGMVFQEFNLVGNLSVFHNALHGALGRSRGPWYWSPASAPRSERLRAMECLERVNIGDLASRRADSLSGGQKQRVAIARTLMQQPSLILADEPVASLDPRAGREVMDLLWELGRERGMTVLCTLHQLDLALDYAERVIGLKGGRVVLDEPASGLHRSALERLYDNEAVPELAPAEQR